MKKSLQLIFLIIITGLLLEGCNDPKIRPEQKSEKKTQTTVDKIKYLDDSKGLLKETTRELEAVNEILNENNVKKYPDETPFKLMQEEQKINNIRLRIKNNTPPETMKEFQDHTLNALSFFGKGSNKAADGFKTNNRSFFNDAERFFNQGNKELELARDDLNYSRKQLNVDGLLGKRLLVAFNKIPKIKFTMPKE